MNVTPITRPVEVVRTEDVVDGVTIELTTDEARRLARLLVRSPVDLTLGHARLDANLYHLGALLAVLDPEARS
jgi:hypothetical protein